MGAAIQRCDRFRPNANRQSSVWRSPQANGNFDFSGLPSGKFLLAVPSQSGFAATTLPLPVTANVAGIHIALKPQSVSQEITVGDDQQALTTRTPQPNRGYHRCSLGTQLRKLPVFDQDYLAKLRPFLTRRRALPAA